jgi:hypothetical protein
LALELPDPEEVPDGDTVVAHGVGVGVGVAASVEAGVGVGVGVGAGVGVCVRVEGDVLAMVLVADWVVAAPPLTLGCTLISGLTLIVGEKLITAVAMARSCPPPVRLCEERA